SMSFSASSSASSRLRVRRLARPLLGFLDQLPINLTRVVVCFLCFHQIPCGDAGRLLGPALIYGIEAPLGTLTRRANGLATDQREDRVRVRGWKNTGCDPTALLERHLELQLAQFAVGSESLARDGLPVYDDLHGNVAGVRDACALDIPVGLLVIRKASD